MLPSEPLGTFRPCDATHIRAPDCATAQVTIDCARVRQSITNSSAIALNHACARRWLRSVAYGSSSGATAHTSRFAFGAGEVGGRAVLHGPARHARMRRDLPTVHLSPPRSTQARVRGANAAPTRRVACRAPRCMLSATLHVVRHAACCPPRCMLSATLHVVRHVACCPPRFDLFNQLYNPMGNPALRTIFLKTSNFMQASP